MAGEISPFAWAQPQTSPPSSPRLLHRLFFPPPAQELRLPVRTAERGRYFSRCLTSSDEIADLELVPASGPLSVMALACWPPRREQCWREGSVLAPTKTPLGAPDLPVVCVCIDSHPTSPHSSDPRSHLLLPVCLPHARSTKGKCGGVVGTTAFWNTEGGFACLKIVAVVPFDGFFWLFTGWHCRFRHHLERDESA